MHHDAIATGDGLLDMKDMARADGIRGQRSNGAHAGEAVEDREAIGRGVAYRVDGLGLAREPMAPQQLVEGQLVVDGTRAAVLAVVLAGGACGGGHAIDPLCGDGACVARVPEEEHARVEVAAVD